MKWTCKKIYLRTQYLNNSAKFLIHSKQKSKRERMLFIYLYFSLPQFFFNFSQDLTFKFLLINIEGGITVLGSNLAQRQINIFLLINRYYVYAYLYINYARNCAWKLYAATVQFAFDAPCVVFHCINSPR